MLGYLRQGQAGLGSPGRSLHDGIDTIQPYRVTVPDAAHNKARSAANGRDSVAWTIARRRLGRNNYTQSSHRQALRADSHNPGSIIASPLGEQARNSSLRCQTLTRKYFGSPSLLRAYISLMLPPLHPRSQSKTPNGATMSIRGTTP
jgi:hypothetical protein